MIQSLARGLEILEYLSERKSAGCTEVAAHLDVNKSTAFRLLETLMLSNFVEQDADTNKYKLGTAILHMRESLIRNTDLVSLAKPYLSKLVESTQESAHLCLLSNDKAVIVDQVLSKEVIKVSASIGRAEPIHASSVGKCILAFQNASTKERMLSCENMEAYTKNTFLSQEDLESELEKIRSRGYAIDDEEVNIGVRCVAAPIRNYKGETFGCIGVSGPATRIHMSSIEKYANVVQATAMMISNRLGYKND